MKTPSKLFETSLPYTPLLAGMSLILIAESDRGTPPTVRIADDGKNKKVVFDTQPGITMSLTFGADLVLKSAGIAFGASLTNIDMIEKLWVALDETNVGLFEDLQLGQATEIGATHDGMPLSADHGVHLDDVESPGLTDLLKSISMATNYAGRLTDDHPFLGFLMALSEETKVGEMAEAA